MFAGQFPVDKNLTGFIDCTEAEINFLPVESFIDLNPSGIPADPVIFFQKSD